MIPWLLQQVHHHRIVLAHLAASQLSSSSSGWHESYCNNHHALLNYISCSAFLCPKPCFSDVVSILSISALLSLLDLLQTLKMKAAHSSISIIDIEHSIITRIMTKEGLCCCICG